jgi:hypothetical protein
LGANLKKALSFRCFGGRSLDIVGRSVSLKCKIFEEKNPSTFAAFGIEGERVG